MGRTVLVFGSNDAGMHGAGAAKTAYEKHGARWGFSYGHMGDSFAIPTKDADIRSLPIERVQAYIGGFIAYAKGHPKVKFKVTRIGCGLAGFRDDVIAPLFAHAPSNCTFDEAWKPIFERLNITHHYWGTF